MVDRAKLNRIDRGVAALLGAAWLGAGGAAIYLAAVGRRPLLLAPLGLLAAGYGALWLRVSLDGRLLGSPPWRRR